MIFGQLRRSSGLPVRRRGHELERIFDEAFGTYDLFRSGVTPAGRRPAINVSEEGETFRVEAEVPGLKLDDLEISVDGRALSIKSERQEDDAEDGVRFYRRERRLSSFSIAVELPEEIDADKVEAGLEHGVLTVSLPRAASARSRRIEVKALGK